MLSEIDIRDYEPKPEQNLYDVKRDTLIKLEDQWYFFKHIDGMYSLVYEMLEQGNNLVAGNISHIKAWTVVVPWVKK